MLDSVSSLVSICYPVDRLQTLLSGELYKVAYRMTIRPIRPVERQQPVLKVTMIEAGLGK